MSAALLALLLTAQPAKPATLPFLHDDWPRALAEAQARHKPILVEAWAPW